MGTKAYCILKFLNNYMPIRPTTANREGTSGGKPTLDELNQINNKATRDQYVPPNCYLQMEGTCKVKVTTRQVASSPIVYAEWNIWGKGRCPCSEYALKPGFTVDKPGANDVGVTWGTGNNFPGWEMEVEFSWTYTSGPKGTCEDKRIETRKVPFPCGKPFKHRAEGFNLINMTVAELKRKIDRCMKTRLKGGAGNPTPRRGITSRAGCLQSVASDIASLTMDTIIEQELSFTNCPKGP